MDARIKHQTDIITNFYDNYDEDGRLAHRHNSVEFLTTMRYVEKYLSPGAKVLEVGAGTGRYSRSIADKGFAVEAVELVQQHIDIFQKQITPAQNIRVQQGNALDLHMFADNSFDITLSFGPMYHLYTPEDKHQAIAEALRVTKPGGVVCVAYCISDCSILDGAFRGKSFDMAEYIRLGKIDPVTFATTSTPEDIFELVRKEDIDHLMVPFGVERLNYVATDLLARYLRDVIDEMDAETFAIFMRYHYAVCDRSDMVGMTTHSLDIFRKPV